MMANTLRRFALASIVVASMQCLEIPAYAQSTPPISPSSPSASAGTTDIERAERAFAEAKAAAKRKDWPTAHALFAESFRANESYETAANLGHVALKLGKYAESARYLSYALRHYPTTGDRTKRSAVEVMLAEAKSEVAQLRISATPSHADVSVDGIRLGPASSLSDAVFVDAGEHVVVARAEKYEAKEERIAASRGSEHAIALTLAESADSGQGSANALATASPAAPRSMLPSSAPSDAAHPEAEPRDIVPGLVIGGGITTLALAVGVGFTLAANSAESDADAVSDRIGGDSSVCASGPRSDCAELRDKSESVEARRDVAVVGFSAAGVAALATALYVLWPTGKSDGAAIRPTARIGSSSAEISVWARF